MSVFSQYYTPCQRALWAAALFLALPAAAGQFIQLKDFTGVEVRAKGFNLPADASIHVVARGGGYDQASRDDNDRMYAYGWIIDADTRQPVWKMDRNNTMREKDDRTFDDYVFLRKGSYEVYYAAYGYTLSTPFGNSDVRFNIDRRSGESPTQWSHGRGFFAWLVDLFGGSADEWRHRAKEWGITLSSDNSVQPSTWDAPRDFPNVLFKATRLGENERIKQSFAVSKPMTMRIYALGEMSGGEMIDYGWIIDQKSHHRLWEMRKSNIRSGGNSAKDIKYDGTVEFPAGDYVLYFNTDDSHSFVDWNAAPPDDPMNYGVTLMAANQEDKGLFALSKLDERQNVIIQLTQLGNNETRSANFTLKKEEMIRVYAIGERGNAHRQMADFGWIINDKTREKVWTMDVDETEPAGGADKNRMVDETITLPKGSYTVFFETDDSHAYNRWNDSPPYDPEHWGITLFGAGEHFSMNDIELNAPHRDQGIIAQIVQVRNNANEIRSFYIDKPTHVRIYALGEGQNHEMYDYGWIENAMTGSVVWEMTYAMTFHAGGGRKNRLVQTTLILDKGNYRLHYTSDDSHSFNDWNTDPPDDPTMWGITLYRTE